MKARKPTPNRSVWPPRITPKRKRALALLREWADKHMELEYSAQAGVTFTGTLSELSFERRTSFLFRNDFGVHALLQTDLFDGIEINEIRDLPINVAFHRKGDLHGGFSIRPRQERAKAKEDLERACELFRHWERLDTMLTVITGDVMCSTVARGKVRELPDRFLFTIAQTETAHLVAPDQSTLVHLEAQGDQQAVVLYNERSGRHFTVTNRDEKPEDVMSRFSTMTTLIQ